MLKKFALIAIAAAVSLGSSTGFAQENFGGVPKGAGWTENGYQIPGTDRSAHPLSWWRSLVNKLIKREVDHPNSAFWKAMKAWNYKIAEKLLPYAKEIGDAICSVDKIEKVLIMAALVKIPVINAQIASVIADIIIWILPY